MRPVWLLSGICNKFRIYRERFKICILYKIRLEPKFIYFTGRLQKKLKIHIIPKLVIDYRRF